MEKGKRIDKGKSERYFVKQRRCKFDELVEEEEEKEKEGELKKVVET